MEAERIFIHGLESSSRGTKGVFFRERYPEMIIKDFKGILEERMEQLKGLLFDKRSLILVGSSYGGLMAAMFACENERKVKKLILLAPALSFQEFEPCLGREIQIPVIVFHGKNDDVVPVAPVQGIARRLFKNLEFNVVDDDHVLSRTFKSIDWNNLLEIGAVGCQSSAGERLRLRPL